MGASDTDISRASCISNYAHLIVCVVGVVEIPRVKINDENIFSV